MYYKSLNTQWCQTKKDIHTKINFFNLLIKWHKKQHQTPNHIYHFGKQIHVTLSGICIENPHTFLSGG